MDNSIPYYRLYLNEKLRKFLGINLKNKKIYIFKVKHKTYLSTTTVPKSEPFSVLTVYLGNRAWYIRVPKEHLEYKPTGYRLLNTKGKVLELIKGD